MSQYFCWAWKLSCKFVKKGMIKDAVTPWACCYTALWNVWHRFDSHCMPAVPFVRHRVYSDEESEIRSTDAAEVRERKESNARTRAAMASLRDRMEQTSTNKVRLSARTRLERCNPWPHVASRHNYPRTVPSATKPAVITVTSFSLWRHSLLSWPRPAALRTYVRTPYRD